MSPQAETKAGPEGAVVRWIDLRDFRSHRAHRLELAEDLTVITGDNGTGKTNLLEAIAWLSGGRSFRGAPTSALVRRGAEVAYLRAEVTDRAGRTHLLEAALPASGRVTVNRNRQRVTRHGELASVVPTVVFSPDDLELIKGGPALRRALLDDTIVGLSPRRAGLINRVERVLRQRAALLRAPNRDPSFWTTLDVFDATLTEAGDELVGLRRRLVDRLGPLVDAHYRRLAGRGRVTLGYRSSAPGGLGPALAGAREVDVARQQTTVGPHRDDLEIGIDGLPARSAASQGEQRSLAIALRLAVVDLYAEGGRGFPVLLLDDVFSELDEGRQRALLEALPAAQTVLTCATGPPPTMTAGAVVRLPPVSRGEAADSSPAGP